MCFRNIRTWERDCSLFSFLIKGKAKSVLSSLRNEGIVRTVKVAARRFESWIS